MAVALTTLVPTLQRTLNPPGTTVFTASSTEWVGRLADAFWTARLQDFFIGYVVDPVTNAVTPVDPTADDLSRDMQSAIVSFAALTALRAALLNTPTGNRAKAGSVEVETQRSATLLVGLLKDVSADLQALKDRILKDATATTGVAFLDSMLISANRTLEGSGHAGFVETVDFGFVN